MSGCLLSFIVSIGLEREYPILSVYLSAAQNTFVPLFMIAHLCDNRMKKTEDNESSKQIPASFLRSRDFDIYLLKLEQPTLLIHNPNTLPSICVLHIANEIAF